MRVTNLINSNGNTGKQLRKPKIKTAFYSLAEIKELFTPVQLETATPGEATKPRHNMTAQQFNVIRAHNAIPDGLKLGPGKQAQKPHGNTPLFRNNSQINLF